MERPPAPKKKKVILVSGGKVGVLGLFWNAGVGKFLLICWGGCKKIIFPLRAEWNKKKKVVKNCSASKKWVKIISKEESKAFWGIARQRKKEKIFSKKLEKRRKFGGEKINLSFMLKNWNFHRQMFFCRLNFYRGWKEKKIGEKLLFGKKVTLYPQFRHKKL